MATTLLRIDGMSCDHCAQAVAKALESLAGVSRAMVVPGGRATVEHATGTPPLEVMLAAIQEEGYGATAG